MTGTTVAIDTLDEGRRLVALLDASGVRARLLGGVGVALHGHGNAPVVTRREYADLDFVVRRRDGASFRRILEAAGYEPNQRFNALHGHRRLLYYDGNGRQIDAFLGDFAMCHALDLDDRLPVDGYSIAPADLLLTKLQIVQINDKDLLDVLALMADHAVGDDPAEKIERARVAVVLGRDWGWHTTVTDNLVRVAERIEGLADLPDDARSRSRAAIADLITLAASAPKSIRWRARARMGRRMPWYELPEEVGR